MGLAELFRRARMKLRRIPPSILLVAAAFCPLVAAKDKPQRNPPRDGIEVVGHLALNGGDVTRFIATRHYNSYYLYAARGAGNAFTLLDVTQAEHPAVLADVAYPPAAGTEALAAVAGTAALVTIAQNAPSPAPMSQTLRVMSFADPRHPAVQREFSGVTAIGRDERRGLFFIANSEGLWVLRQRLALDPAIEDEYARYVLYSH